MSRMSSILSNTAGNAINNLIGSKYDVVKAVADNLDKIEAISVADIEALTQTLNEAKDFTGITVVTGDTASWDASTKTLTVPVQIGPKGDAGKDGARGPQGIVGPAGLKGDKGEKGDSITGPRGYRGATGNPGANGLSPIVTFSIDDNMNLVYDITYTPLIDQLQANVGEW